MLMQSQVPHWWYRFTLRFAATPTAAWLRARRPLLLEQLVGWASSQGYGGATPGAGSELIWLTTRDEKNGLFYTMPVMGIADGDDLILLAVNWGQAHYPTWYHNLRAHREASVRQQGETHTYWAREVGGEERRRAWQRAITAYPRFADYARPSEGRAVPVLILTPALGI